MRAVQVGSCYGFESDSYSEHKIFDKTKDSSISTNELSAISSDSLDEVVLFDIESTDELLDDLFRVLIPGGRLVFNYKILTEHVSKVDLGIRGFLEIKQLSGKSVHLKTVTAQKPKWRLGESADITLKIYGNKIPDSTSKWTMNITDLAESDLIDENDLLDNENIEITESSCGVENTTNVSSKKRACKNCSCGLAEIEAAEEEKGIKSSDTPAKSSACGNCYKGDAFRCASCPFLGKPAFEPGVNKVMLSLAGDDI